MSIKNKIYNSLPESVKIALFRTLRFNKPCGYGEIYSVTLNKAFETFLTPEERADHKLMNNLTDDIVKCWVRYKALPYEYFLFNFRNRTDRERMDFETDMDRISTLCRVSDNELFKEEINDKYNFYLLAKLYFNREAIRLNLDTNVEEFVSFCKKHSEVFIKPLEGSKGKGAHVYSYIDEDNAEAYCKELLTEGSSWMVEERIKQSAEMGQWNETSVNTIRIPTFLRDDKFTVIWTRLRMGKKGAIVDNAGAGGIVVNVDPETGVITSDGIDESYNHFERHPGSGLVFKGWQVPRWDELLKTVEELHRTVFSKHVYVAWDFALTDDGWVVIEGNWGQLLGQQTASQVGVRKKFHELIGDK
ncbi:MAG: hypothetical protein J6T87_07575 [Bacteroidales bacterium]|nr:hypothetical protein [Bacteroidales bacterium]